MQKILISSCLLGNNVRYDGQSKPLLHPQIMTWLQQDCLVIFCPEVSGGLPIPRPRAECANGQVIDEHGHDVTVAFERGANQALDLCKAHNIKFALLKEFSPSCGVKHIYDGQFIGNKIKGQGFTSKLLTQNGIKVFNEFEIDDLNLIIKQSSI